MTVGSSASRAYVSKRVHAVGTCICLPTVSVQPVSAITSGSRSWKRALIASAAFASSSARASGVVCDHAGNASCAARAASSAWADERLGRDGDRFLGGGVDDVVAAVGSVDPFPADQQLPVRRHAHAAPTSGPPSCVWTRFTAGPPDLRLTAAKCNAFYFWRHPSEAGVAER